MAARIKKLPKKLVASAALIACLGGGYAGYEAASTYLDTVAMYEGYVPEGYLDPVGIPTKCFGDTSNVVVGLEYSFDECAESINRQALAHARPVMDCIKALNEQPARVKAAILSMTYNIGTDAMCSSSVASLANAGEWERACYRIREIYKTARGKALPGLAKRRLFESNMCLEGLKGGS